MADGSAELEEGGFVRTLKDLFAGAAGGVAQVLLGMGIFFSLLFAGGIEIGVSYMLTCHGRFPLHGLRKLWSSFRNFKGNWNLRSAVQYDY